MLNEKRNGDNSGLAEDSDEDAVVPTNDCLPKEKITDIAQEVRQAQWEEIQQIKKNCIKPSRWFNCPTLFSNDLISTRAKLLNIRKPAKTTESFKEYETLLDDLHVGYIKWEINKDLSRPIQPPSATLTLESVICKNTSLGVL